MKVLIVGAGPSGLMCALKASEKNQVIIIEKNYKAGMKIYITGKGRCNVTNNCSKNEFINNVVSNPKFMYSSINNFSCQDTMSFFSNSGVNLVTERGNRVFPYSYHASDITKALLNACLNNHVTINYSEKVISIEKDDSGFKVFTDKTTYLVDSVVLATGGKSYPQTGSTGDGYQFAKEFDIKVVKPQPGLVPLLIKDQIPKELFNFTFKNVGLTAFNKENHKVIRYEFGELMMGKKSLSGPISLTISSIINKLPPEKVALEMDLKPALDDEKLKTRIEKDIEDLKKKPNSNAFILVRGLVPSGMILWILRRLNIDSNLPIKFFNEKNVLDLISVLKHFSFDYLGLDSFDHAIITSGGIDVKEINPKTMEVKKIPGLYIVGELIDVDAFTGGFNMQIAFSTGYSAGLDLLNKN